MAVGHMTVGHTGLLATRVLAVLALDRVGVLRFGSGVVANLGLLYDP